MRVFQRLALDTRLVVCAPGNPLELVEFCDLRLKWVRERGYNWPGPAVRDRMLKWLRQRVEATPKEMQRIVWCHEDYGPYNVMWDGRVLTPIDFDTCRPDLVLVDVANMNHWIDMLPIQCPWRRWPIIQWKRAYLRGYGLSDAERVPIYSALKARCLLARLKKSIEYPGTTKLRWVHNLWCRHFIHAKLDRLISMP